MTAASRARLFEGYGIEIEWMIVDAASTRPRPLAEFLLEDPTGVVCDEVQRGRLRWSNELASHVIEAKTEGPQGSLEGRAESFLLAARTMNALLAPEGACLLGGGMHPILDPAREVTLWPYDDEERASIYRAYHRIFGCRGHGFTNVQSTHLNLAFGDDEELVRLHDAVRHVLPLVPALAAASPFVESERARALDERLRVVRRNQERVPEITGQVIPERIASRADYEATILEPMYRAIAPHDPEGLLAEEWLNSRGAIARFDRMALELRLLDAQETPVADFAIAAAVAAVVRAMVEGALGPRLEEPSTFRLRRLLDVTTLRGEQAWIDDAAYLRTLGARGPMSAGELWADLLDRFPPAAEHAPALAVILEQGPLARRMVAWMDRNFPGSLRPWQLAALSREMAKLLPAGRLLGE